jgi:hypothetical protein
LRIINTEEKKKEEAGKNRRKIEKLKEIENGKVYCWLTTKCGVCEGYQINLFYLANLFLHLLAELLNSGVAGVVIENVENGVKK